MRWLKEFFALLFPPITSCLSCGAAVSPGQHYCDDECETMNQW